MVETAQAPIVTRPPHYPTAQSRDTVRHLVSFGLDDDQISYVLRCLPSEVRHHYADELKHGLARVNAQVQAVVLNNALINHDTVAAKLWLQNKAGWRAGDGMRIGIGVNGPETPVSGDTQVTVTERRTVIERVLTHAAQLKRASVTIEGKATEVKSNGGLTSNVQRGNGARNAKLGGAGDAGAVDGDRLVSDVALGEARKPVTNTGNGKQPESPGLQPDPNRRGNGSGNGTKHR